jgi:hypothetical protein
MIQTKHQDASAQDFEDPDEPAATREQTLQAMIGGITRVGVPIRSAFLQKFGGDRAAGPLHLFVTQRQRLALQLYLLLRCVALGGEYDYRLANGSWARALGLSSKNGEQSISRAWTWLRQQEMVRTERDNRILRAYVLDDAGGGTPYVRPKGRYFTLPMAYFRQGHHIEMSLAETATLLISLYSGRGGGWWELPAERAALWYGISADTLQRGLDGLQTRELLARRYHKKTDPLARYGRTQVAQFRLLDVYATAPATNEKADQ